MKLPNLPSEQQLMEAPSITSFAEATIQWDTESVPKTAEQSQESYLEQKKVLTLARQAVQDYQNCTNGYSPQNLCIVGGPGTGKTTVMMLSTLNGICNGLIAISTALLCERSLTLGGRHLNWLLAWPVCPGCSPGQIAEKCIANLLCDGVCLEFL